MTYRPNPESLAARVLGFLALHPSASLTLADVAAKFVEPEDGRNIHTQLMIACDHDMLIYDPEQDSYCKGPVDVPSAFEKTADDEQASLLVKALDEQAAPEPPKPAPKRKAASAKPRRQETGEPGSLEHMARQAGVWVPPSGFKKETALQRLQTFAELIERSVLERLQAEQHPAGGPAA
ncbi:hypothetical protein [Delftia sp. PE138]|uniref:hypothetical protein n=1 Tax=Delftia sp. PE138 TaxID=1812483 RepID=UPI001BAF168C|nr:hypothetical protein [Delftia sp. PE138]MBS3719404.1 hypothetical protein [Delftia sp. PE138]